MRSIIQFGMAAICIGLVGAGLFISLDLANKDATLNSPGTPGRLVSEKSIATAFFEMDGDRMELTMLLSNEDDPKNVLRARVLLANGQSHSIVVADPSEKAAAQRYVFKREGDAVRMSLETVSARATFVAGE